MNSNTLVIHGKDLYLRTPTPADEEIVWEFRQELFDYDSYSAGDSGLKQQNSFNEWIDKVNRGSNTATLPKDRVLCTQFLTFRKSDNRLIGMIQVRHDLNEYLLNFGGHIGDCIRPTERHKGYATEQKKICFEFCKSIGLNKVLITAKSENVYSIKSILKCNAEFENQIINKETNQLYNRYWINLY